MKPLIYIYGTPKFVEEETVKTYRAALERAGAQVRHSSDPADAAGCDGLLLAGGGDMDPAYFGQIVLQTFPLIGNYGVIEEDVKGKKIIVSPPFGQMLNAKCEMQNECIPFRNIFNRAEGTP